MANEKTLMFYGILCLSKPNETACAHVLYTDVIICIFSMFAALMYLIGDQVSIINLLMSIAGNGFMILNSIVVRKSIPIYAERCIAVSGTRCYRFIRVILYVLSFANTIFPVVSIARGKQAQVDDSNKESSDLNTLSPGLRSIIILCIVLDFLTSVWGLILAIPFNVAVLNLDEAKRSRVFPTGYFHNQDISQFDDSVQDFQPDPNGYGYRVTYNPIGQRMRVIYAQPLTEVPMRAQPPPEIHVINVKHHDAAADARGPINTRSSVQIQQKPLQLTKHEQPLDPRLPDESYEDYQPEEVFQGHLEPKPYQRPVI
jgi:hypothetical protein